MPSRGRRVLAPESKIAQLEEQITRSSSISEGYNQPLNQPSTKSTYRDNVHEYTWSETCNWTLVHSFYANMGGLLYIEPYDESTGRPVTHPATAHGIVEECRDEAYFLLKDFILEKRDIEDKSKVDWLLKAIAVSQILRLTLDVATRGIANLPVTQLEIATVAFSLMAVATYVANWGKPKDIVEPTVLRRPIFFSNWRYSNDKRNFQGFVKRLLAPSLGSYSVFHEDRKRIKNNTIWMEGDTPLIAGLMAISSLIFGGLHCLAWNFDFPTGAELALWRIASLASGALPSFALGVSLLLSFLATSFADKMRTSSILKILAPLERFPPAWWNLLRQKPEFLGWPREFWFAFRSLDSGSRNWDKAPDGRADPPSQAEENDDRRWLAHNLIRLNIIRDFIVQAKEGRIYPNLYTELFLISQQIDDRKDKYIKAAELWDEYEEYLKTKIVFAGPGAPPICCLRFIIDMKARVKSLGERSGKFRRTCDQASRFLTISTGIIYTIARVTILVLLFTSLRSVPEGIYEATPWTRSLPNIS